MKNELFNRHTIKLTNLLMKSLQDFNFGYNLSIETNQIIIQGYFNEKLIAKLVIKNFKLSSEDSCEFLYATKYVADIKIKFVFTEKL